MSGVRNFSITSARQRSTGRWGILVDYGEEREFYACEDYGTANTRESARDLALEISAWLAHRYGLKFDVSQHDGRLAKA